MLSATALTTALVVTLTSNQLPRQAEPIAPVAALAGVLANDSFDFDAAERMRAKQCLLNLTLRRGGRELKAVSSKGLNGTEAELHIAAESDHWQDGNTPLTVAWDKDDAWTQAKFLELDSRIDVWEESLDIRSQTTPPGYTVVDFQWIEDEDDPFSTTGLTAGLGAMYFHSESDLYYTDQTPVASKESVDAVNTIAAARYSEDRREDGPALDALKWEMTFMHPMYADDARIFLQHGGFPTTAPAPDTMEFRLDVEALKARFASCTTHNPIDPYNVLGAEVALASVEWQNELSGQKAQRAVIMDAEAKASGHLRVAAQAMGEALGQSLIANRLTDWQAYWLKAPSSTNFYPAPADFAKVKTDIERARERAQGRVFVAGRAALAAQVEAARADKAKGEAYAIADAAGLPRGRGLMYGQQALQVSKASAAAAQAAFKATETAANATRASASDSKTLMALAETQAHAMKAEFRRKAAEEAEAQAKAAAEGAAYQAKVAAENAAKAKEAENRAKAAEAEAKTAAADAAAKRKKAEAEAAYAKSQKELADTERAKAGTARAKADAERQVAADKLAAARTAGATAATKKDEALTAERNAVKARDNAITAEGRRDALEAKAFALEARAEADEGTDAAAASRTAATEARTAADEAGTAAASARTAADSATAASANARAAATRAEGAAKRAQAAADAAKRDVAITEAAVAKATAATADAIDAAEQAKWNAITAKAQAATAQGKAAEAKGHADVARQEAIAAVADSVRAAGFAYATAQAAVATRSSAQQVIKPANDAIELGSPYADTDTSAGLAVLIGQASKTHAEQQAALAKAKSAQAAVAAAEAKAIAARATTDAKAAAEAAARSAEYAANATASAEAAQASADVAAKSVEAAKKSLARTLEYDRQAKADAEVAQGAANSAGNYAAQADAAASEAEKDAGAARTSATAAESDASTANSVATKAEQDATKAEEAAGRADEAADEAEQAATRAENTKAQESISTGGATGIGGVFTRQNMEQVGEAEPQNPCMLGIGFDGCTVKFKLTFNVTVDFYLCQGAGVGESPTAANCPTAATTWVGSQRFDNQIAYVDHYFTRWEIVMELDKAFLKTVWHVLTDDFVQCAKGSVSGCLWAASNFIPGKKIADAVVAIRALDAALKTGVGVADAYRALKAINLDPQVMAAITQQVNIVEDALTTCVRNSFPAETGVLMADGTYKPVARVGVGDLVRARDMESGALVARPVTDTFRHDTDRLLDIRLADGSVLTSTSGHKVYVMNRGWTMVADLRVEDRLVSDDGVLRPVSSVTDRRDLSPRTVYDLTVGGLHTFYVSGSGDYSGNVLVHNCLNIIGDEGIGGAHTLSDHVHRTDAQMLADAQKKGRATRWNDEATAARAVAEAFSQWAQQPGNADSIAKWVGKMGQKMAKPGAIFNPMTDLKTFRWELRGEGPLGRSWVQGGPQAGSLTGSTVVISLKYVGKGHAKKYVVYTSYPE
ncbi:polymorphic toxin-type HINT domain-containing protein [Streptomyces sp. NPDC056488]|uniref:polymorphic toxin-type HINT domain-containing protein n=1 Tax=Streptomyces sp. NPDC056488 TaxID=3345836 RepID=UPI0036C02417